MVNKQEKKVLTKRGDSTFRGELNHLLQIKGTQPYQTLSLFISHFYFPDSLSFSLAFTVSPSFFFYFPDSLCFSLAFTVFPSFFFYSISLSLFISPFLSLSVTLSSFLSLSLFLSPFLSLSLFLLFFIRLSFSFPCLSFFLLSFSLPLVSSFPPHPIFPCRTQIRIGWRGGIQTVLFPLSPPPSPPPLPLPLLVEDFNIPLAQRLKDRAYADRAVRRTLVNSLPNFTLLPLFMSANKLKEKERAYADRAVRRTLVNFLPNFTLYSSAG